jgi:hypothetical protein
LKALFNDEADDDDAEAAEILLEAVDKLLDEEQRAGVPLKRGERELKKLNVQLKLMTRTK